MTITALLAAGRQPWESDLVRAAATSPALTLVRRCVDVADAVATAASGEVRVALLSIALPGLETDMIDRISSAGVHPVGVLPPDGAADAPRAAALGLRVVVMANRLDGVAELVAEADEHPRQDASPIGGHGRLITVWGPTGAPGRSTVALGIASETARAGISTLLVDADVYGGSIAQMLAILDEVSGVLAAARSANSGRLARDELIAHTRRIAPDLLVLTGIPRSDRWPGLRPGAMRTVLDVAREVASVVVVDVGFSLETDESISFDTAAPRRNGATLAALEQADHVVVVGSSEPLGLTRLTRGVFDLRDAVPGAQISVVVNKVRPGLGWSRDQIGETINRFTAVSPVRFLPLDQAAVDGAWLNGRTLAECAPESPLRTELAALAKQVTVPSYVVPTPRRRRLRRTRVGR